MEVALSDLLDRQSLADYGFDLDLADQSAQLGFSLRARQTLSRSGGAP
jgi:hypothetical protein